MRTDENGTACPETLGEYRDLCAAIGGAECPAAIALDKLIKEHSRETKVALSDLELRTFLMPMLVKQDSMYEFLFPFLKVI